MMRLLVSFHRWLGIGLCLFFTMWFASGLVMMYVPFPALPESARLAALTPLDTRAIKVAPGAAIRHCGPDQLSGLRLLNIEQRPAYICHFQQGPVTALFADDGSLVSINTSPDPKLHGPFDYDQWVVHQRFDPYRPFFRRNLNDEANTKQYFAGLTGELLQQTTAQQRTWNYLGAVVHWIYPTVLRQHWALWDQTVWWLSLAAMIGVVIGIYLGVKAVLRMRNSGRAGISPYRAWMRWHHILGLVSGTVVLTWIFSGWLSMDHGRLFSVPDPTAPQAQSMRGGRLADLASTVSVTDLQAIRDAKEVSFHALAGQPILTIKRGQETLTRPAIDAAAVATAVSQAWPDYNINSVTVVPDDDIYTSLREGSLPPGTYRATLDDKSDTWIHINSTNGEIVSIMDRSRRTYRWLYNGLHSLDFPGLVDNRPLWITIMTLLLATGLLFSITGVVISARRLLR